MPVPAALLAQLAPGAIKLISGLIQGKRGNEYENVQRPTYEIPGAVKENLSLATGLASNSELPGADAIKDAIGAATGRGLKTVQDAASSSTEAILGSQPIIAGEQEQLNELGVKGAMNQQDNQRLVSQALQQLAVEQEKQFQYNQYMPYLQSMDAARKLSDSSLSNIFSGLSDTAGVLNYGLKDKEINFGNLFGGEGKDFTESIGAGITDSSIGNFDPQEFSGVFENLNFENLIDQY